VGTRGCLHERSRDRVPRAKPQAAARMARPRSAIDRSRERHRFRCPIVPAVRPRTRHRESAPVQTDAKHRRFRPILGRTSATAEMGTAVAGRVGKRVAEAAPSRDGSLRKAFRTATLPLPSPKGVSMLDFEALSRSEPTGGSRARAVGFLGLRQGGRSRKSPVAP